MLRGSLLRKAAALAAAFGLSAAGCGSKDAPGASGSASASASSTPPAPPPPAVTPSASASAAPPPAPEPKPDAKNETKPPEDAPELQQRAKGLFDAIVKDDPTLAEGFWFPKEPFVPLKDVKDPGKYWDQLHKTYGGDVHRYHKKRKSWDGATFVRFELGSKPKWVPPGKEANKIGYHRSFHGKLRWEKAGKKHAMDVHTVISWQGKWFVTHLDDFKKKRRD